MYVCRMLLRMVAVEDDYDAYRVPYTDQSMDAAANQIKKIKFQDSLL